MEEIEAKAVYKSSKSNFISLPHGVTTMLYNANINAQDVICELVWGSLKRRDKQFAYMGWSGFPSPVGNGKSDIIEVDPALAGTIGLDDGADVVVNLKIQNIPIARVVELEPLTSADWELVELNAGALESNLLFQTRCVFQNQTVVVHPSSSTTAHLKVLKFETTKGSEEARFAKLANDTELYIKPKVAKKQVTEKTRSRKTSSNKSRGPREKLPHALRRGIALPHELFHNVRNDKFEVYLNSAEFSEILKNTEYVYLSVLKHAQSNDSKQPTTALEAQPDDLVVEAEKVVARAVDCKEAPEAHVGLSRVTADALGIPSGAVGHLIVLEPATRALSNPIDKVIIHPYVTESQSVEPQQVKLKQSDNDIAKKLAQKNELLAKSTKLTEAIQKSKFLDKTCITNFSRVSPAINEELLPKGGLLEFGSERGAWIRSITDYGKVKFELGTPLVRAESFLDAIAQPPVVSKVVGQDDLIGQMVMKLKRCKSGALLYGDQGRGKTVITRHVAAELTNLGVHVTYVNCEQLAMEASNGVLKKLDEIFKEVTWYSPSTLILEDVDALAPSEQEHGDNTNSRQSAEFLVSKLKNKIMKRRKVGVLFTAKNKSSFNSVLQNSHLIEEDFNLRAPSKELRRLLLEHFISSVDLKVSETELLNEVAAVDTEGYNPADLKVLIDRVQYSAFSDDEADLENCIVKRTHFDTALQGFTPSSLRGVKLQKSTVKWEDIGGLRDAKSILLETLEWPTKYAPIFANCPLRLRSGILLYGYPGCGKTLLASAVASQCGLNFISIKGPEILNKYIGASEQSVRELFDRAQAAKPCILFFDEFDSIAPKRGHDSTGVTDRVVNQMLTQMDGAEGLDGVYVLAATSRPDLIDSALLRPGRLDKSVICDVPDSLDRLDILKCITAKMDLAEDVDVEVIAERTENFSGADLQAVGYNAYLLAVHEKLDADEEMMSEIQRSSDASKLEFFQLSNMKTFKSSIRDMKPAQRIELTKKLELIFKSNAERELASSGNDGDGESAKNSSTSVILTQRHLVEALKETKPSISEKERSKLAKIYRQFSNPNEREGNMPDGMASMDIGGRSTLA